LSKHITKEKNVKRFGFVLMVICLLAIIGCNTPEPPKFGVVDVIKVVNSSKAGQKANAEVEALVKAKQAELNDKGEALKKLEKGLKEQPPKGKADDLNRAAAEYQRLAAAADAELKKKAGETRKMVFEQIKKAIETIGQEEKFVMIFTTDNVPYFQPTTDLTDKVIKKYDESTGGK
jgi:Skp family chaperone for outer membrane proteins